jgi:hypothetical protein
LEFGGLTNWNFRIGFSMQQCISFLCLVWTWISGWNCGRCYWLMHLASCVVCHPGNTI